MVFSQTNFEKAEKLFVQEKYALAKPMFENILKENPNHLKTLEYLGDIEGSNKSWDKALIYYDKLKRLNPSNANYYYKYGGCLGMKAKESNKFRALGMIGDVKANFEKAIQINPNHVEARWALIELYLQLPAIIGGSEHKAQKYAYELQKISPVDGYLASGHIAEYFEKYKDAEKLYSKAIAIGGSKVSYQKLANLYKNKMNQPEKAKTLLENYQEKKKL
ncbi:tetratricopeptide repeat protein [Flavobacterium sp.]|uniref:tetratricopeptide repeat protein n=1 Tax=Flavobacterium sp. TaxID=239 RepID=UPI0025DBCC66|nr:tetratricopeptide repeat protein [Flavobacterium sp.]